MTLVGRWRTAAFATSVHWLASMRQWFAPLTGGDRDVVRRGLILAWGETPIGKVALNLTVVKYSAIARQSAAVDTLRD